MPRYEFNFAMTCEGCSGAAKRVLGKIGVTEDCIEIDMDNKKIYVTSDKPSDEILATIKKTGKDTEYVGSS